MEWHAVLGTELPDNVDRVWLEQHVGPHKPCVFALRLLNEQTVEQAITGQRQFLSAASTLIWLVLLLLLSTPAAAGAAGPWLPLAEHRLAFLAALEGPWQGQARVTPIGPRPYDMTFVRTAPQQVAGEAHPGASTHFWTFYEEEAAVKLRFLSTFGGNQHPLYLTAMAEQDEALVFHAPQPGFLEVHVRPQNDTLTIKIFLRGKPHVEIHLVRN